MSTTKKELDEAKNLIALVKEIEGFSIEDITKMRNALLTTPGMTASSKKLLKELPVGSFIRLSALMMAGKTKKGSMALHQRIAKIARA